MTRRGGSPDKRPIQYSLMIATQVPRPFHRDRWIHEENIDGWRMLAYKSDRTVRLESRSGVDHTRRFPDLAKAVATLPARTLVLDGEVAIFDRQLRSRFDWLPGRAAQRADEADRHKTGDVYRRYAIDSHSDLKAAALKLDGYNHGDNRGREVDAAAVRV